LTYYRTVEEETVIAWNVDSERARNITFKFNDDDYGGEDDDGGGGWWW
jgi:hypothetical protein